MTSVLEPGVRVRIQRTINNVTGFFQCIVSARHEIGPDPLTQSAPASTEATVVNTKSVAGNNAGVSGSSHNVARYCYDVVLGTGKTVEKVARSFLRFSMRACMPPLITLPQCVCVCVCVCFQNRYFFC